MRLAPWKTSLRFVRRAIVRGNRRSPAGTPQRRVFRRPEHRNRSILDEWQALLRAR